MYLVRSVIDLLTSISLQLSGAVLIAAPVYAGHLSITFLNKSAILVRLAALKVFSTISWQIFRILITEKIYGILNGLPSESSRSSSANFSITSWGRMVTGDISCSPSGVAIIVEDWSAIADASDEKSRYMLTEFAKHTYLQSAGLVSHVHTHQTQLIFPN